MVVQGVAHHVGWHFVACGFVASGSIYWRPPPTPTAAAAAEACGIAGERGGGGEPR